MDVISTGNEQSSSITSMLSFHIKIEYVQADGQLQQTLKKIEDPILHNSETYHKTIRVKIKQTSALTKCKLHLMGCENGVTVYLILTQLSINKKEKESTFVWIS